MQASSWVVMNPIYWIIANTVFDEPITGVGPINDSTGFIQTFGCTMPEHELRDLLVDVMYQDTEWLRSYNPTLSLEISAISPQDVEEEISSDDEINDLLLSSPLEEGLWYKSGRIYYHEDDEDDETVYLVEVAPFSE